MGTRRWMSSTLTREGGSSRACWPASSAAPPRSTRDPLRLMKRLARLTYVTDVLRPFVAKAVAPDDIVAAKDDGRHCLYLSGNGVPLAQRWTSVEEELGSIRLF